MKKINFQDTPTALFQDNVAAAVEPIEQAPLVAGVLLMSITLTSAQDNLVRHGLGHTPTFYLTGTPNADTRIWSPVSTSLSGASANSTFINLRCSTTCVVSIWVSA